MTGFISRPHNPDADPEAPPTEIVSGDGWWPDVDVAALRETVRLPTDITPARLREAVRNAMIGIDRELADWRACRVEDGAENLDAIEAPQIEARSKYYWLYDRAIGSLVAADLAERYRDIGATTAGADRAEELEIAASEHRRNYRWAVSDIRGVARTVIDLI